MMTTDSTIYDFSLALAQMTDELLAIPDPLLRPVNLDIPAAVVAILGAMPKLQELRPEVVRVLGESYASPIDRMPNYAKAAYQAHADHLSLSAPAGLQALSESLVAIRDVLETDAVSLVKRKLADGGEIAGLRGNVGFQNQITDTLQLVGFFRRHWARIESITPVTTADLENAARLAATFANALGEREKGPASTSESAQLRTRAYTQVVTTWDEIRRVVTFLRWHQGDGDAIAPSLWAGRGGRRSEELERPVTPVVAGPTTPWQPATPATPAAPVVTPPAVPPIAPGLPGASPFITR